MKLRGIKGWGLLGGIQTPAIIKSPQIEKGSTFDGIFHITDWLATLTDLLELENVEIPEDSFSQYSAITGNGETRQEVFIHVDKESYGDDGLAPYDTGPYGSMQMGDYVLIGGQSTEKPLPPMWYSTVDTQLEDFVKETIGLNQWQHVDLWNETRAWWLFNVEDDPIQSINLLGEDYLNDYYFELAETMRAKIEDYAKNSIADPISGVRNPNGYPICVPRDSTDFNNCFWTPGWCDNNGY